MDFKAVKFPAKIILLATCVQFLGPVAKCSIYAGHAGGFVAIFSSAGDEIKRHRKNHESYCVSFMIRV
ncbi:hypothetical protein DDR33_11530 [Pararcticibacter amylolyticus]|uniref:Uncharacterized protein n=1 Tax=Pararcticibacter amylolyticus TaxID=2173175 RepID=A0A2U2PGV7_9SPHI|nr:hypothetical protein DDR33_11530 [Pararcticibacter amylolyticus]